MFGLVYPVGIFSLRVLGAAVRRNYRARLIRGEMRYECELKGKQFFFLKDRLDYEGFSFFSLSLYRPISVQNRLQLCTRAVFSAGP